VAEETVDRAVAYLSNQFAEADLADSEGKAVMLHSLSQQDKAEFEFAHRLYRMRDQISEGALALLALTFVEMERKEIAGEVLETLLARAQEVPLDGDTGVMWSGRRNEPWLRSDVETTALAILAAEKARPEAPQVKQAMTWLMAQRRGAGWWPAKAEGPALAAACGYYAGAERAAERYRLAVRVNETEVKVLEVTGASSTTVIEVPSGLLRPSDNRVDFDIEGRGQYAYAAALTGVSDDFKMDGTARFRVDKRRYEPPAPLYKGRPIRVGFEVARDYRHFRNEVSQLPVGSLAKVSLHFYHRSDLARPAADFLVVEESVPAGATLVEGSVSGSFDHFGLVDGRIIFYTRAGRSGAISYDLYGFTPGEYRVLPTVIRGAYGSEVLGLNNTATLTVLARGERSTDKYRPTPDELYYYGKALFDDGRLGEAQPLLARLYQEWTLRDEPLRETARILLYIAVAQTKPAEVVKYFEVLRERYPNTVIPFDKMLAVAQAYRQVGEQERAYQVFAAIADASFLRDAAVPGVIEQQGGFLESVDHMLDIWRAYPDTPATQSAYFAVSQALYEKALKPDELPKLRKGLTKQEMLLRTIGIINCFLTFYPDNPITDEASFSLANAFLELEDHESVVQLARRFHAIYPNSAYADDFRYIEAVGEFWLGHHEQALKVAMEVAESKTVDERGVERESKNKWLALYIAAQIYHATRQPAEAVKYYKMVADRYPEANEAADYFAKQTLSVPELTIVTPDDAAKVTLTYRNLNEADVRVYRVDLMRLYLTRRSLAEAARIDLAGVSPLHTSTTLLNENTGAQPETKELPLEIAEEGAYLVLARSGNIYASGLLLITPLVLEVQEEADAGRLRVNVRNSKSGDFMAKVHVKVIGSQSGRFVSGETDLRGVFIADGLQGKATAIARGEGDRYAFFRGETWLGPSPEVSEEEVEAARRGVQRMGRGEYLENVGTRNAEQQAARSRELRALYEKGQGYAGAKGGIQAGSAQ
jgi:tetratricopeptide (TPR) repeat protein